ncbi:MAG: hypothetical protein P8J55_09410, partial [Pseudomonadales bacterium]|nr:hypothetical protein [Pseudomonadales bacterium]
LQSHSGVDKTLLAWMASKTPEQRLQILQNNVTAIIKARNGRRHACLFIYYIVLKDRIETVDIADGLSVKILELDTLIDVKEKTARSKDNHMLEILRAMKDQLD